MSTTDTSPDSLLVYVVSRGEDYEGSSVEGIFSSIAAARAFVPYLIERMSVPWKMKEVRPEYWHGGCDYIEIEAHAVYTHALPCIEAAEKKRELRRLEIEKTRRF